MERSFTSKEAKRLVKEYRKFKQKLEAVTKLSEQYLNDIKTMATNIAIQEVCDNLEKIPVEELNRDRPGIRTKLLRDSGFTTIAQLMKATEYEIGSVYGISVNSAFTIKNIVNNIVELAIKGAKIQLSIDNKTAEATQLVLSISKYRHYLSFIDNCRQILSENDNEQIIQYALKDIEPGTNSILWLFTSKTRKQKVVEAFNTLSTLLSENFGSETRRLVVDVDAIEKMNADDAWHDFEIENIRFFNILEEIVPGLLRSDNIVSGLPDDLVRKIQDQCFFPNGLLCTLRRYQEWGVKYILHQERVLLGDEMGLGKTIQAIAVMVSLKNTGATHFVVVCPASVLVNWCREIHKHSKLSVTKIHGLNRYAALKSWLQSGGVAVTTYDTTQHFILNADFKFELLVVDEAHYIKNAKTNRTLNVKQLCKHSNRLLFMTGTALENNVDEMVSLISILQPIVALKIKGLESISKAPLFRTLVAPVYYRRKREDVLTELPDLIINQEWCTLLPIEEDVYDQAVLKRRFSDARCVSWSVYNLNYSSKANRMCEIIDAAEDDGRKVIVFSFFLDTIRKISIFLGSRCLEPITGSVNPQRRLEIIDEFNDAPAGTVLVAQIQSGGTGLNIQAASIVILCEPQLKPSIENQAISRAYRMGQSRNVLVYKLLCEETIDERISDLLFKKQEIFNHFADESVAADDSLKLDKKTVDNLIEEEIKRINAKKRN